MKRFALSLVLACMATWSCMPAAAQDAPARIPPLKQVPAFLAAAAMTQLTKDRERLTERLSNFQAQGRAFNSDCAAVVAGSPKERQCRGKLAELSAERSRYIAAAEAFNKGVDDAVRTLRVRLETRLKNAQEGGRSALYAWAQLASGSAADQISDALAGLEAVMHLQGKRLAEQAVELNVKLVGLLRGMQDCRYGNDELKTACENVKVFQNLVRETVEQLKQLPEPDE